MLRHRFAELKFLGVKQEVLGAWGQYDAVPMKFGSREVGCWGEYWSVKCMFVSSHCESHYMCFFLLGKNVAYDKAICYLGALGGFVPMDEK